MKMAAMGAAVLMAMVAAQSAGAQDALASATQAVVNEIQPVHVKAQIVGIDTGNRSLTLKGPDGNTVAVLVSQQMAGFDQLKIGDRVDVLYKNALLVNAERVTGADKGIRKRVDTQVVAPASGGFESARQVEVLATVLKLDRQKRQITLRGAHRTQTLEVGADVDLNDVKVGDTIHAVFVSAAAVQVTPQGAAQ